MKKQLLALADAVKALQQPQQKPPEPAPKHDLVPVDRVTREEFNALTQLVYEQEGALGDVAKRISQSGMDRYVVNLRGAMEVPEFRKELTEAVHDVIRQQGTLRIDNRSAVEHRLRVNGLQYLVPALGTIEVHVPVGTLTTELAGYEPPKNWTVGPPNYHQGITITRTAAPTVFIAPPVIVDAPVFGPPLIVY